MNPGYRHFTFSEYILYQNYEKNNKSCVQMTRPVKRKARVGIPHTRLISCHSSFIFFDTLLLCSDGWYFIHTLDRTTFSYQTSIIIKLPTCERHLCWAVNCEAATRLSLQTSAEQRQAAQLDSGPSRHELLRWFLHSFSTALYFLAPALVMTSAPRHTAAAAAEASVIPYQWCNRAYIKYWLRPTTTSCLRAERPHLLSACLYMVYYGCNHSFLCPSTQTLMSTHDSQMKTRKRLKSDILT